MDSRKASDILLELESKIEILLNLVRTQDLNIKILSNKVNDLNEKYKQVISTPTTIKVETADTTIISDKLPISSESNITTEKSPKGFRRTSRPETYAGDDKYLNSDSETTSVVPKFPTQIPKLPSQNIETEVIVPSKQIKKPITSDVKEDFEEVPEKKNNSNNVPLIQRVVNNSGKSVFLADIEIIDLSTMNSIAKTRTNGTGKWMSSLPIGKYRVFIRKRESINKDVLEVIQDIVVDGSKSPFELQTVIIR